VRRALRAVERVRTQHVEGTVAVVAHGGVVRAVLADVLGMPDERIFRIAVEPASLAIVEWVEAVPTLVLLGGGVQSPA